MGTPGRDRDTARMNLVIGLGEIGRPLMEVLRKAHRVEGIDLPPRDVPGPIDLMHVCYPGDISDFAGETAQYTRRYEPALYIKRRLNGFFKYLILDEMQDVKGGAEVAQANAAGALAAAVAQVEAHFQCAGMKTRPLSSPEATELAKLTETTYLGLLIAFAQDVDRMARATGVPYDDVAGFYEEIGYLPPVRYFPGVIGGHCVMANVGLLERSFESRLLDAIKWSNELRKGEA